ncbi:MAG: hypothetical protein ACKOAF_06035 [Actinomycetes bacterium]
MAVFATVKVVALGKVNVPKGHAICHGSPDAARVGVTVLDEGVPTVPVYEFGQGHGLRTIAVVRVAPSVHARVAVSLLPTSHDEGVILAPVTAAWEGVATPTNVPATTAIPTIAVIPRRIMLAFLACAPMA